MDEYIEDEFNMTGLRQMVPYYNYALEMILDIEEDLDNELPDMPDVHVIENSAERLYGLVHARYIITRQGLQQMSDKYLAGHFGTCPRFLCHNTFVVPCGRSDTPSVDSVKLYCPQCKDIYSPASTRFSSVDGAYFGTSFPQIFFMTFPSYLPTGVPNDYYVPRIYGFKVSEHSKAGPRMEWLRQFPESFEEDEDGDEEIDVSLRSANGEDTSPRTVAPVDEATAADDQPVAYDQGAMPPVKDDQRSGVSATPDSAADAQRQNSTKDIMAGIEQTRLAS
ncbi:casein kinase 2 regulatory subunit [Tieghemiomyces parasiticus]|uniref:Casein kinase II subunit beta n=1 Tax=Tieghemiomyces parasiticus TaxID=78921 RepID=A0A9W8DR03_9FUNG|nr:casein kinase 2 regulatory subunit [Tieghemiomyces parasiticus]